MKSATFDRWLRKLGDRRAAVRVQVRIDRLANGNAGDVKPVGAGISELRISCGPGYRVYYLNEGQRVIFLLCGGDKSTQARTSGKPARSLTSGTPGSRTYGQGT